MKPEHPYLLSLEIEVLCLAILGTLGTLEKLEIGIRGPPLMKIGTGSLQKQEVLDTMGTPEIIERCNIKLE